MRSYLFVAMLLPAFAAFAAEPDGYYSSCENKSGKALLQALASKITSHTNVGYDGLWDVYPESDARPDRTIWDMYSTKHWSFSSGKCGNYKNVGDCYNREHSFPKSWFSEGSPMKSDAFHVYPTDGKVNGQRSNHPYGECEHGTRLPSNGSVQALGRLGSCTFPGYSGTVFEPDDEYKGDFARTYFYMAACYNDRISGWSSPMLAGNNYPVYKPWAVNLLLKWHRQDPVSEKEIKRNDAVYRHQRNRNPFIDHPELAEYVWGDRMNQSWTLDVEAEPQINTPVSGSSVNMGVTAINIPVSHTIVVKGTHIAAPVNVSISGSGFSVSAAALDAAKVNSASGAPLEVTYLSAVAAKASARLTLSVGDISSTVSLSAEAIDGLPAADATDITDHSFTARCVYVGDTGSGNYPLDVRDASGSIDGYPRAVPATAGRYVVDGLDHSTAYTYTLASDHLTSRVVSVTTPAPLPSVEFLYDGDLSFNAAPGEPSEVAELLVEIDNIDTDVNVSVAAPFQISTDKYDWTTSLTLSPLEDRIYMRLFGDTPGVFTTAIVARAGEYFNDDSEVTGTIVARKTFIEEFESSKKESYTDGSYTGDASQWFFCNAGVWDQDKDKAGSGVHCVRFGSNADSYIEIDPHKENGVGQVSFTARRWNEKDGNAKVELRYSSDGGANWHSAGSVEVKTNDHQPFTFTVNCPGNVKLRVQQTYGKRLLLDSFAAADYTLSVDAPATGEHSWDAFCRDGKLIIESEQTARAAVHGMDGITRFAGQVSVGSTALDLPAGLYVVVIGDHSRRVLVK